MAWQNGGRRWESHFFDGASGTGFSDGASGTGWGGQSGEQTQDSGDVSTSQGRGTRVGKESRGTWESTSQASAVHSGRASATSTTELTSGPTSPCWSLHPPPPRPSHPAVTDCL